MTFLSATPDLDTKVALINTLVSVSEGKVRSLPNNSTATAPEHADPVATFPLLRFFWRWSGRG